MYHDLSDLSSLVLIHIIPKEHSLVLADTKEQVNTHTFFTPSYCNPIKVDMLESVLSPQVRLTAANTLKIDILFHRFIFPFRFPKEWVLFPSG